MYGHSSLSESCQQICVVALADSDPHLLLLLLTCRNNGTDVECCKSAGSILHLFWWDPGGVGVLQSTFLPWESYRSRAGSQYVTNLYQSEEARMGGTRNNCHVEVIIPLNFQILMPQFL